MTRACINAIIAALAIVPTIGFAQPPTIKAVLKARVEPSTVRPGATVRLAADVQLPQGAHVQSDQPRDPLLIPTALTIAATDGLTIDRIIYPAATDLTQAGQQEPLAVFGERFTIEIEAVLSSDTVAREIVVPGKLRYQACDERTCYPPARADTEWRLTVAPAVGKAKSPRANRASHKAGACPTAQ